VTNGDADSGNGDFVPGIGKQFSLIKYEQIIPSNAKLWCCAAVCYISGHQNRHRESRLQEFKDVTTFCNTQFLPLEEISLIYDYLLQ
jgi:hypothetical protein